ncbi:hypothetical protein AK812_SmicGene18043 [Symbiodinium microadriaticum]|uniref:Uncharacterized protein n=1 Tax=Symbiodinium microadriaticum TaxID=2951 RepID=A0A1Q9DW71_SYMMI|nr:hypothetical protein AK812_SmicGene18043 [Symbiodinium microadriaticum]
MGKGGKWGGWNGGQGQGLDPRNESQRRREAERRLPLRDELGVVRSELARSEQLGGQLLQRCEAAEARLSSIPVQEAKVVELQAALATLKTLREAAELRQRNKTLAAEQESIQQAWGRCEARAKMEVKGLEEEVEEQKFKINKLRSDKAQLLEETEEQKEKIHRLHQDKDRLKDDLSDIEKDCDQKSKYIKDLGQEKAELRVHLLEASKEEKRLRKLLRKRGRSDSEEDTGPGLSVTAEDLELRQELEEWQQEAAGASMQDAESEAAVKAEAVKVSEVKTFSC